MLFWSAPFFAQSNLPEIKIAFLADIHFQDLYGSLSDNDYKGITNPSNGKAVLLRTMDSQLHSTRIFNENYFALFSALDDIVSKGIKIVALPGDYTDDGQPLHVRGLSKILNDYSKKYDIQFFITTGNHDPAGPFEQDSGKDDFLGEGGKNQPIYSKTTTEKLQKNSLLPVITKDIVKMGYEGIFENLSEFGFFPKKSNLFWATPFSSYDSENYTFEIAQSEALLKNRTYQTAPGYSIPDASYLVEPVAGLWLLAIDGNTYPIQENATKNVSDATNYKGADLGYNNLEHKNHLLPWIKKVVAEAKRKNKTLIAFSHYPMCDFNDNASNEIKAFMGQKKWQLQRVPSKEISDKFADTGLKIHFGGHMHINDTGIHTSPSGNTLVNIQTPSLAAYVPAYKMATLKTSEIIDINTITIKNVPRFNELFSLYEMEHNYLVKNISKTIWNKNILKTKNYLDFTDWHLKELVKMRFIPDDWPNDFVEFLKKKTGLELFILANSENKTALTFNKKEKNNFKNWTGADLINDFYRIRSGDVLAENYIGKEKIACYKLLAQAFSIEKEGENKLQKDCRLFFTILKKFLEGAPSDYFSVNLQNGEVLKIKK